MTHLTKKEAVDRLVSRLSSVPTRWLTGIDTLPMWGTSFLVTDPFDRRAIDDLLIDIAHEGPSEELNLSEAGWKEIQKTDLIACWYDNELVIGIDGAGYDFYEAHWEPLYDALGIEWHRS